MYVDRINVKSITIDYRVQRPLDSIRVDRMVRNFKPDAVGVVCVSKRSNGTFACLDGQHRVAALKEVGISTVNAEIFEGLSLEDEAKMFIERNTAQKVPYLDNFWVRVTALDPIAVGTLNEVNAIGWRLARQHDKEGPEFSAVKALEQIYRKDPELAATVLYVTSRAFGIDGADYRILGGIKEFYRLYDGRTIDGKLYVIDKERLIHQLSIAPGGTSRLIDEAQALYVVLGKSVSRCVATLIAKEYNRNLRTGFGNRLPDLNLS